MSLSLDISALDRRGILPMTCSSLYWLPWWSILCTRNRNWVSCFVPLFTLDWQCWLEGWLSNTNCLPQTVWLHKCKRLSSSNIESITSVSWTQHVFDCRPLPDDFNLNEDFYIKPYIRFQPYLIGILMGFVLYRTRNKPIRIPHVGVTTN